MRKNQSQLAGKELCRDPEVTGTAVQETPGRKYLTFRPIHGKALRSDVDVHILVILNTSDASFKYFQFSCEAPGDPAMARFHTAVAKGFADHGEIPAMDHGVGTSWYKWLGLVLTYI